MRSFEFASPLYLWLLVLLPFLCWWMLHRGSRPQASIQYSNLGLFKGVRGRGMAFFRRYLPLLRLIALALLIIALARPRFGTVERDVIQEGVDLFYAIDISGSMRAEDFRPNRLAKAKEITAEFSAKRETDRQGIVVFSGEAFMLCPLSFDNLTVQRFLESISFDDVGVQGTAIGLGMARALKKLQDSRAKSKVIILMTDGAENINKIRPEDSIKVAKELGVRVYTIGVGSRGVTTIPIDTPRGVVRQRFRGELNEELLEKIASETGGIYRRATNATELQSIFDEIDKLEKTEIEMKEYRSYDERMAVFVWAGLIFLLCEFMLAHTRFIKIP
ncbi:MAG: VWA domain-containing protein [Candidatus Sumerlaeia bacterium]